MLSETRHKAQGFGILRAMRLRAGSSGFSYKEWKGNFYPEKAKNADMLKLYSAQLDAVEINATFYRMPKASMLEGWAEQVPDGFTFVLKASQRITHRSKLEDVDDNIAYLWSTAQSLGAHLGPILFQLPPFSRRDDDKLDRFLGKLPKDMRAVMEFRHRSWFDEAVFERLRSHGASLCFSDTDPADEDDPGLEQPFVSTAPFGYVRLRRASYDAPALGEWITAIRQHAWEEVFVFFKHEPTAPGLALSMIDQWKSRER